jgi:hypothetical protein
LLQAVMQKQQQQQQRWHDQQGYQAQCLNMHLE